jgi:hypothetical protein
MQALARRHGLGPDALYRHRKNHLTPQLKAALLAGSDLEGVDLDRLREVESQSLLQNLVALRNRLFAALDVSEEAGDVNQTSRIAAALHRNFELVGKLLGDLNTGNTTINNVLIQPQYITMRVELVRALAPYPEARHAVAAVLHRLEGTSAGEIATQDRGLAK